MDFVTILIFIGFVLSGIICGLPIGYILGRRSMWHEVEDFFTCVSSDDEVLNSEVIR